MIANCNRDFRCSSSNDHWVDVSFGFFKIGHNNSLYITVRDTALLCSLRTLRFKVGYRALRFDHVYSPSVVLRLLFRWYWSTRLSSQFFLVLITYLISELAFTEMAILISNGGGLTWMWVSTISHGYPWAWEWLFIMNFTGFCLFTLLLRWHVSFWRCREY